MMTMDTFAHVLLGYGPTSSTPKGLLAAMLPSEKSSTLFPETIIKKPSKMIISDLVAPLDTQTSRLSSLSPIRHDKYYFNDGNVVFLADNVLFKVHRHFFQTHSEVFSNMFTAPDLSGEPQDGACDDRPIALSGTSSLEFEIFLGVVYPPILGTQPKRTTTEWLSIAAFSHKFMFDDLERVAVNTITERTDDPIAHVYLGRQIDDEALLRKGYMAFAKRTGYLNPAEAELLGVHEAVNLCHFRELARMCKNGKLRHKEPTDDLLAPTGLQWYDLNELLDTCLPYFQHAKEI